MLAETCVIEKERETAERDETTSGGRLIYDVARWKGAGGAIWLGSDATYVQQ